MTNTLGLMSLFVPGPARRHFGWEVQGDQLRTVVITSPRDPQERTARETLVEEHHLGFLRLDPPPGIAEHLVPVSSRKPWLGHEPDFVHRYLRLAPVTTWSDLLRVLVWPTERTHAHVRAGSS